MTSHLAILVNGKPIELSDDFSIDIEDSNPIFNATEMFSYPFTVPLDGNRRLVKNIDDLHAGIRAVDLEHSPTQIVADGMPFRSGTLVMSDGEEISGELSMNIDAGTRSFSDLISNMTCRDVPVKDTIVIGEKIGHVRVHVESDPIVKVTVHVDGSKDKEEHDETTETTGEHITLDKTFEPQALGFSYPAVCEVDKYVAGGGLPDYAALQSVRTYKDGNTVNIPKIAAGGDYINTSAAYGETDGAGRAATYCNARVCYKHYGLDSDGSTSSGVVALEDCTFAFEDYYPYWVLDARRPQSGICFYVLYFLDCLFAHLGVSFDKSALLDIEDFKHLCFFTTVCSYDVIPKEGYGEYYAYEYDKEGKPLENSATNNLIDSGLVKEGDVKSYYFQSQAQINAWLNSRGCGGQIDVTKSDDKTASNVTWKKADGTTQFVQVGDQTAEGGRVTGITITADVQNPKVQANVVQMVANSGNFPEESVSTVIDALESAFGIKFHYDYERKHVTAYLIRDVLRRSGNTPRDFKCDVHTITPITEKITGVRMRYSEESDAADQKQNVTDYNKGKNTDYETDYDYVDYREPSDSENGVIYDKSYKEIFHDLSNGDRHCYIDVATGNAYRVKINSDATTSAELKPVLFEVGQFKGVEYGDCGEENEDFIHDISIDFQPVSFNDVNYYKERAAAYGTMSGTQKDSDGNTVTVSATVADSQPILCAFVDEDMEHEFVEQIINETISCSVCDFYLKESLKLIESYDPTGTDDGNSPLQDDSRWGFALALMRGGGSDATLEPYDYNYDGFGNSKWRTKSGQYALASDSLDAFGNVFDYNGTQEGVGDGERFSLKIRAYKEPSWLKEKAYQGISLCRDDIRDENGNVTTKIRSRGLFDTFMLPYAYFLLNRKKMIIRCSTTVAQVADVANHWFEWWNVGGVKCLIDKVNTTIDRKTGIGEVELTVYSL